jgi:folate-dependent phosphoribosylglycinamide formyltransferase PurN
VGEPAAIGGGDEGVDDGPVLGTATVDIDTSSTFEAFAALVHATEHRLLVDTLTTLCTATPDRTEVSA